LGGLILCFDAQAANLGVIGPVYPILEEDFLKVIQQKLMLMQQQGLIEKYQGDLQQRAKTYIARPKPVGGITTATENRTFYVDPSVQLSDDIRDTNGHILYSRGTLINPLQNMNFHKKLIFINGDDKKQVNWAQEIDKNFLHQDKLILINGDVQKTASLWKRNVYFDQAGRLCQRLGIHHVPALVTQQGLKLRINEIALLKEKRHADVSATFH
jgi:conjugal transfer pilus assembly protein TraW